MNIPTGHSQVNLKYGGDGMPTGAEVTFGIDNSGAHHTPDEIADLVEGNYVDNILPAQNSHVTLVGILVKNGPNEDGPFTEHGILHSGLNTSGDAIPNCCALVRKVTALGGRAHRGRWFLPILGESDIQTGGLVSGTFLSGLQDALDAFYAQLVSDDIPMSLLHTSSLVSPDAVTALTAQSTIATQRRRLRR